jgi:DNA-binding MarR family transcriptional regulator
MMTVDRNDFLRLDRQVCFPLYAASNLLTRLYRPVLAKLGLTYPQYLVMLILWETTPLGMAELGARLHLDSGTLTPMLKRLEAGGFITRVRDRKDERRVLIDLTATGLALRERAAEVPVTLAKQFNMAPEELDELRAIVGKVVETLSSRIQD